MEITVAGQLYHIDTSTKPWVLSAVKTGKPLAYGYSYAAGANTYEGAIPRMGMSIPMPASTKPPAAPSGQQSSSTAQPPAARLSQSLQTLRWSARALAEQLGCNPRLVQRWLAGERGYAPPEPLLVEIEAIADVVSQWRATDWRRRSPQ